MGNPSKILKKPPKNGAELRRQTIAEFEVVSAPALALLDVACAAFDQALAAEACIARDGICVENGRGTPRAHPATTIARDARNRMIAALRSLHLDL
jgi:phage terminase small subunit